MGYRYVILKRFIRELEAQLSGPLDLDLDLVPPAAS